MHNICQIRSNTGANVTSQIIESHFLKKKKSHHHYSLVLARVQIYVYKISSWKHFKTYTAHLPEVILQWKPVNVITLGLKETDSINQMITIKVFLQSKLL